MSVSYVYIQHLSIVNFDRNFTSVVFNAFIIQLTFLWYYGCNLYWYFFTYYYFHSYYANIRDFLFRYFVRVSPTHILYLLTDLLLTCMLWKNLSLLNDRCRFFSIDFLLLPSLHFQLSQIILCIFQPYHSQSSYFSSTFWPPLISGITAIAIQYFYNSNFNWLNVPVLNKLSKFQVERCNSSL